MFAMMASGVSGDDIGWARGHVLRSSKFQKQSRSVKCFKAKMVRTMVE